MKLLFALIFVCFTPLVIGYESGKEYRHKLEAYVHSFIRNTKSQYAGTATIADVIIQVQENTFNIKINNIKFDVANELLEDGTDFFKYPFTFKDVPAFSDEITKPFKVTIDKGHITQFFISEDEPEWSVTLKKGFLNLLQLSFNRNDTDDDSGESSESSESSEPSDSQFFTVSESGTLGECETTYTVNSQPTEQNSGNVLNVTKIRNYEKCKKKPHPFIYASEYGIPCTECGSPNKIFRAASLYEYNLKGTRDQYVIEKVVQREQITRTPFGSDGLTFEIYSKRILELLSVQDISDAITVSNDIIAQTDLTNAPLEKHEFFDQIDLRRAHYLNEIYRYQVPTTQIVSLIEEVGEYASYDANSAESPLPSKFAEIVDALSTLDYEDIEQVFGALSAETAEDQRQLFFDALAATGTNPSFLFGKSLIEQNKFDGALNAQRFLVKLSLSIKEPSESLFNEYYQLCLSSGIQAQPKLKQACYLSFSALVSKECVQYYFIHKKHNHFTGSHYHQHKDNHTEAHQSKHHCKPEIANKYFKLLINTKVEPTSSQDTILFIKTAGNFRVKDAIPFLKKLVENSDSHYIRATAAWNLMGFSNYFAEDIRAIAAPLFFNTSEEQDVRIAAFQAWILTRPKLPQLLLIGRQLVFEKNRQIVNYVYSTIKSYGKSELPCTKKHSSDIQNALWLFKIAYNKHGGRVRHGDSFAKVQTRYDEQYQLGALRVFSVIANNNSYIPSNVYLSMHNLIGGQLFHTFSVSINSYGVEKVINRLFGLKGTVWRKPSKLDIFKKRVSRDASILENEVKEIEKNLPIAPRESDDLKIQITFSRKGYQLAYEEVDESRYASIIKDGTISIPDITRILGVDIIGKTKRSFLQSLNRIAIIRSEIGVPYFFQYRVLDQLNFHSNKLNFNIIPGLFSEDRDNKPATEIELSLDMKYTHDIDTYALSGLLLPVIYHKVGAGVNRRMIFSVPINRTFTYYVKEKKLESKRVPEPLTIFYDKVTPFTYADSYSNKVPLVAEPGFKPIYTSNDLKQFERNYLQEFFGYGVKVSGNLLRKSRSEWYKFYSEKSFGEKYLYYLTHPTPNPYEIKVSTALSDSDPTTDFTLSLTFGDKASESENEVTDFSNAEDAYFTEYTARSDRRPETHSLKLELSGGGNIQRTINAELVYSHSEDDLVHKINFKYDRSPINDNGYKVCAIALTKFPSFDISKFVNLDTLELDQTANLTLRVAFGESCENDAKIVVNAVLSQTDEQKRFEQTRDTLDPKNPYSKRYQYCKTQFQFKYNAVPYCAHYLYPISQLRKLEATIDTENIPTKFLNATYKFMRKLNAKRDAYLDISYNPSETSLGQIRFASNTSVTEPIVDSSIVAPRFTANYKSVPHSPDMPPLFTFPLYNLRYVDILRRDQYKPFCVIQENLVQTFDNVSYTLPSINSNCYAVLAKDCSHDKIFTVLSQRIEDRINLKIYFGSKFKVEFITTGDEALKVKVNGNEVPVSQTEPYRQSFKIGNREFEVFTITYNGAYYRLDATKARLDLTTDGKGVLIQTRRYYNGKLCGLCGDSNGDANYEFRAANGHVLRNANPFVNSYLIPSDVCTPPTDLNGDNNVV